jgi:hypothetical protein
MTLALRRTVFLDGEKRPDDYEVRYNGRTVGRILRLRSTSRELWLWTQSEGRPLPTLKTQPVKLRLKIRQALLDHW